jgi:hypothetical protein
MWWPFRRIRELFQRARPAYSQPTASPTARLVTPKPIVHVWNRQPLEKHLRRLSCAFQLQVADNYRFVIVGGVRLPPGYNHTLTSVLVEIPSDYPLSPPGIGNNRVYVSPRLRFRGRTLKDVHPDARPSYPTPGSGDWAWWCYQEIRWDPVRDDLIRFMEMFRVDLTNPPVNWE